MNITAAAVVKASAGILSRVCVSTAGNITINDAATTGAAAAANQIFSGAVTAGQVLALEWPCVNGITVSAISGGAVIAVSYT